MRSSTTSRRFLAAALIVACAAASAAADAQSETVALGFQTERAELVAVGVAGAPVDDAAAGAAEASVTYELRSVLRGDAGESKAIVVVLARDALADLAGAPDVHLLFLVRSADEPPRWRPVTGRASVRPLRADGAASRLPDIVARYAAALDVVGPGRDEALRARLLEQIEDADAGIAWSGATDLFRRSDLHAGIAREHAARILAAFGRAGASGRAKEALALAVAVSGDPGAAAALADATAGSGADAIRGGLGDAAEILGGQELADALAARLRAAPAARRVPLVSVLGRVGTESAALAVLPFVADADPLLCQEALHACGRIARNVRRVAAGARRGAGGAAPGPQMPADADERPEVPDPAPPPPQERDPAPDADVVTSGRPHWDDVLARVRTELVRAALSARSVNEKRASLWALAQLDDPGAYAFLRRLARESDDDVVRRHAASYLARPRQSLILR